MSDRPSVSRSLTNFCLRLVDMASILVPRTGRRDWRREWRAELWHRSLNDTDRAPADESLRVGRRQPATSPHRELVYRSLGAFRHAVWLRSQEWKPDMLMQDLRYAVRSLKRAPTFTAMALLTLGIGIGSNTMVFDMVDAVLFTPYPFERPEELVDLHSTRSDRPGTESSISYPEYLDIRAADILDDIAVWDWEPMNLRGADETIYVGVAQVTASLFYVMRVTPIIGRGFNADEEVPGNHNVVVLTEAFWRTHFGADASVIGRAVYLDGTERVIVGVMPHRYTFPDDEVDVWVPLAVTEASAPRTSNWLGTLARMKPGTSIESTNAALGTLSAQLEQAHPDLSRDRVLRVKSLREDRVGEVRPFMFVLLGAVGFLLLIVCANVANLLLARASAREREISVRLALGAGRVRLVRQLLTESFLLSLGGLAIGFAFGNWATRVLLAAVPVEMPVWIEVRANFLDVLFMGGVALFATFAFGLVPALQATRPDVRGALAETSGHAAATRRRRLTRNALIVAEVSISLMLLVGAGLMARSFAELAAVSPGFEADHRLMATMQMPRGKYDSNESRVLFYRELMARLATLPGVERASAVSRMPITGSSNSRWFTYEGQDSEEARLNRSALHNSVGPAYFATMGIALQQGRVFADTDTSATARVVLVNDELAARYFPDGETLGRRISFDAEEWWEIVGVVGSVRHFGLDVPPQMQVYVPYEQYPQGRLSIVMQTSGDPAALAPQVRETVRAIDPDQALYDLMPVTEAVAESVWMPGFFAALMRGLAAIAAAIAAVGIYGVTAYSVSRRTRELGVRLALGAGRTDITRMVIRQSMTVVGLGILIGLALAVGQGMALESILYEVSSTDPLTFGSVVALIVGVSFVAAWLPARRATRLDPVRALRDE